MNLEKTSPNLENKPNYSTHHMSVNIEGLLRNYKRKKMDGLFTDENGKPISDGQARVFLHNCQVDGHKLVPTAECEGFDPFGGGCPGHPITEEEYNRRNRKTPTAE